MIGGLTDQDVCIVNCLELSDLEQFVDLLLDFCIEDRKQFLYRTAASFVQVRAGLPTRHLLSREEILSRPSK